MTPVFGCQIFLALFFIALVFRALSFRVLLFRLLFFPDRAFSGRVFRGCVSGAHGFGGGVCGGRAVLVAVLLSVPAGVVFPAGASGSAVGASLKLATWNMGWLTSRPAGDPGLPDGIYRRNDADIERLAAYADRLDADIIGFQEVDGAAIAARVFRAPRYRIIMSGDHVTQQTGVAIRGSLSVTVHPPVTALNVYPPSAPHPLRSGLDITVSDGTASLRLLVIHLKTGCYDNPWTERQHACPTLKSQFAVLDDWALERSDSGEAFAILGDFNRRMTPGDPFFLSLTRDTPLLLTTSGRASPCWGGEYFIDHILLGGPARDWLTAGSLRVMTYHDPGITPAQLSDHCPVSVRLALP